MAELAGMRTVVTGATSGLGAAMAEALARAGARVAVAARPTSRLDNAVAALRVDGLAAEPLPMDVRDVESVDAAVEELWTRWDGPTSSSTTPGIGMRTVTPRFLERPQPFYEVTAEGFADVMATNLTGYFLVARAFAPRFVARRPGRVSGPEPADRSLDHVAVRRERPAHGLCSGGSSGSIRAHVSSDRTASRHARRSSTQPRTPWETRQSPLIPRYAPARCGGGTATFGATPGPSD